MGGQVVALAGRTTHTLLVLQVEVLAGALDAGLPIEEWSFGWAFVDIGNLRYFVDVRLQ